LGRVPFSTDTDKATYMDIKNKKLDFATKAGVSKNKVSKHAQDFLKRCLDRNPSTRYSVKQLLKHPWLKDINAL
jgi:serine/threonine protein kinase